MLEKGEFDKVRTVISNDKSTISQMLEMGLTRMGEVRRREDIEIAMEESMMEIIPQLEKRTPYVALLSNISTLFGLLGTIMGLIEPSPQFPMRTPPIRVMSTFLCKFF